MNGAGPGSMPPDEDRPVWRERIGTYVLGVAIGLMIVGALTWGRYQSVRRSGAAQKAAEDARGSGLAPSTNNPPTDRP